MCGKPRNPLREERVAASCSGRNWILPAGRARCCHEVGKRQHVAAIVFRISYRIKGGPGAVNDAFGSAAGILSVFRRRGIDELLPPSPSNLLVIPISFR